MPQFGVQLKSWRLFRGLSQTDLALKTGVPRPNLVDIESGKRDCTLRTLQVFAKALNVSPGKLLDEAPAAYGSLDRHDVDMLARSFFESSSKLSSHLKGFQQVLLPLIFPILKSVGKVPVLKLPYGNVKYTKLQAEAVLGRDSLALLIARVNKLAENYA